MASNSSPVKLPYTSSLIIMTGAMPQHPKQRQASKLKRPSGVHSPPCIPKLTLQQFINPVSAFYIACSSQAYVNVIPSLWGKAEHGIKRGNSVNFRQRLPQLPRHNTLRCLRQKAVDFLRLLQCWKCNSRLLLMLRNPCSQLLGSQILVGLAWAHRVCFCIFHIVLPFISASETRQRTCRFFCYIL